jgi:hypothetical protein
MSYYVVKVYGLICDDCETSIEAVPLIDARNKLAEVRKQLAGPPDRWTYRDGKDRCPQCSTRLKETS